MANGKKNYRNLVSKEASKKSWGSGFHGGSKKQKTKRERKKSKLDLKNQPEQGEPNHD